jgi:hypothetical protein
VIDVVTKLLPRELDPRRTSRRELLVRFDRKTERRMLVEFCVPLDGIDEGLDLVGTRSRSPAISIT